MRRRPPRSGSTFPQPSIPPPAGRSPTPTTPPSPPPGATPPTAASISTRPPAMRLPPRPWRSRKVRAPARWCRAAALASPSISRSPITSPLVISTSSMFWVMVSPSPPAAPGSTSRNRASPSPPMGRLPSIRLTSTTCRMSPALVLMARTASASTSATG